ncbi:MAG: glucosaminidase domain-containing protein [Peptostreptococcus sp.]|uniref:glycoside hydrolase family 73 protein n=1 Tax=Peptostreptococcus sp. TaxID=1262 RepID=UPI002FCA327B
MEIDISKGIGSLYSEEEILNNINKENNKNISSRSNKVSISTNKSKKRSRRKKKMKKWPILLLILFMIAGYGAITSIKNSNNLMIDRNNIDKEEFISRVENVAITEYKKSGVLPSITISQAILESSWGNSSLAIEGNNLFGIKADKSWTGEKINFNTEEYNKSYVKADFRKYNSWEESIQDHSRFLMENKRYLNSGLFKSKNYKDQAQALEDAGYATTMDSAGNKIYAEKLIRVIESNKLYDIDNKVINKTE